MSTDKISKDSKTGKEMKAQTHDLLKASFFEQVATVAVAASTAMMLLPLLACGGVAGAGLARTNGESSLLVMWWRGVRSFWRNA